MSLDWLEKAACANPVGLDPRFFPEELRGKTRHEKLDIRRDTAAAKSLCDGVPIVVRNADGDAVVKWGRRPCPVREQCLKLAMTNEGVAVAKDRAGIFGGKTPKERAALAVELGIEAKAPNESRRRNCPNPGTSLGASKHFLAAETYCDECLPHSIGDGEARAVRRMIAEGATNTEIFKRTMADSAFVRVIRIALGVPDPGRRMVVSPKSARQPGVISPKAVLDEAKVLRAMEVGQKGVTSLLTRAERHELVKRAHALGLDDNEISRRYGVHPRAVSRDRQALGLAANAAPGGRGPNDNYLRGVA